MKGKRNIAAGFLFLAAFTAYGFVLIYLRDFAPGKEQWIAELLIGTPPVLVLVGGIAMIVAKAWFGGAALTIRPTMIGAQA